VLQVGNGVAVYQWVLRYSVAVRNGIVLCCKFATRVIVASLQHQVRNGIAVYQWVLRHSVVVLVLRDSVGDDSFAESNQRVSSSPEAQRNGMEIVLGEPHQRCIFAVQWCDYYRVRFSVCFSRSFYVHTDGNGVSLAPRQHIRPGWWDLNACHAINGHLFLFPVVGNIRPGWWDLNACHAIKGHLFLFPVVGNGIAVYQWVLKLQGNFLRVQLGIV